MHHHYQKDVMKQRILFGLSLALCFAINSNSIHANAVNEPDLKQTTELINILKELQSIKSDLPIKQNLADLKNAQGGFTQAELITISEEIIKKTKAFDQLQGSLAYEQLQSFLKKIVTNLVSYKVSGIAFAHHSSFSIFYGSHDFTADMIFKNNEGNIINSPVTIKYKTFGWQNELIYRFDAIFTVGADINQFNAKNPVFLSPGFTGGWRLPIPAAHRQFNVNAFNNMRDGRLDIRAHDYYPFSVVGLTILPLAGKPGSIVIVHFGVGLTGADGTDTPFSTNAFNAGLVLPGGSLRVA